MKHVEENKIYTLVLSIFNKWQMAIKKWTIGKITAPSINLIILLNHMFESLNNKDSSIYESHYIEKKKM